MSVDRDIGDGVDAELRRAAEAEMRRTLPDAERPSKRAKHDDEFIEIGRFDYSAINDLADGVACFLVSCTFRREVSATKEVAALLAPHLPSAEKKEEEGAANAAATGPAFSNLKLSARGLVGLLLKLPGNAGLEEEGRAATAAALAAYDAAESGTTDKAAPHVQRIVPLASTCALEVNTLRACAARVAAVAVPVLAAAERPTFGITVASRGSGDAKQAEKEAAAPQRSEIIAAVAQGFTDALKERHGIEVAVDLKAPAVVVAVEVLPLAGQLFAGIAVLPQRVCTLKPRLSMRPLKSGAGGKDRAEKSVNS